jgi:tetratricopeptide (TPR) repeat protein
MDQWLDFSDFIENAQELIDLGLYEEAETLLDRYGRSFPHEWELHFLYSRCYAEQNRPEDAISSLHKGLRLDPTNVDCLVGLFYAHAMRNQMHKAGEYLLHAEKLYPDHDLVLSALVWYYTETNNHGAALSCFERARKRGTDNPETYRNAGIAYDRAGYYDNAAACFTTALELDPGYDEARELLADLHIATGKPDKAVDLYRQAIVDSPNNIRYLSRLTFCLSQNNEPEKAAEAAKESIRRYPNSPVGYIDLAYVHLNSGALDKAMAAVEKALDISPLDPEAHRIQAIVLSDQGKNAEAEKTYERALSLDDDNSEILRDYYNHLRRSGNYQKMEEIIAQVIAPDDPSCVEDYWFLADYYREKKEYGKALQYLRKAYRIRPGEHDFLSLAADILIARGHAVLSLKFLKRYVERAGWDDVMDRIAASPQLKNRRLQEALRFFRFCGNCPADYRRHIFAGCLRRALVPSFGAVLLAAAFPIVMLFGRAGLAGSALTALVGFGAAYLVKLFRKRELRIACGH